MRGSTWVLRERVRYELSQLHCESNELYRITVRYDGEISRCVFRCRRENAVDIFLKLLRGRVTPCSAAYIIDELIGETGGEIISEE